MKADIIHRFKRKHFKKFNAALTFFCDDSNVIKVKIVSDGKFSKKYDHFL